MTNENNSNGLQAIVSQALATLKEKDGKNFDLQKVNLAELQRMTGISRSRLRRLKENNFQVKPHGRTGMHASSTVLTGFTGIIDLLLQKGVTNSQVCFDRVCEAGYNGGLTQVKMYIQQHHNLKLMQARKNGNVERVVKSLVKPSCLIIDELGYCNFDTENTRIFFDIVDRRYSKDTPNTMIVTSNTEPDKWVTFFNDEPALKCAMDRFFDKALLISMKGRSYRGNCRRKIEVIAGNGMTQKPEQSNY